MESNRNFDDVTERYVVTLEQCDAERSRSRRRRNDETTERADSRRLAQRERQQLCGIQKRLSRQMLDDCDQQPVDRSRSQLRRNDETTEQTDCRRTADRSRIHPIFNENKGVAMATKFRKI